MYDNYDFIIFSSMFIFLALLILTIQLFIQLNEWLVNCSLVGIYIYYDNICKRLRR